MSQSNKVAIAHFVDS